MAQPYSLTFERRIPAGTEAVWAVLTDPHAMTRADRSARVVSTSGNPGEVGSRYNVVVLGVTLERVVTEAVAGRRLVLQAARGRPPELTNGSAAGLNAGPTADTGSADRAAHSSVGEAPLFTRGSTMTPPVCRRCGGISLR